MWHVAVLTRIHFVMASGTPPLCSTPHQHEPTIIIRQALSGYCRVRSPSDGSLGIFSAVLSSPTLPSLCDSGRPLGRKNPPISGNRLWGDRACRITVHSQSMRTLIYDASSCTGPLNSLRKTNTPLDTLWRAARTCAAVLGIVRHSCTF